MVIQIVIVEDEMIIALDLEQRLKKLGYEVIDIAASGADAIKLVKSNEVDLIFMDIFLKGKLNGIETARLIEEDYNIPIIYNSANSDILKIEAVKNPKHYEYLVKPFNNIKLQRAIKSILDFK